MPRERMKSPSEQETDNTKNAHIHMNRAINHTGRSIFTRTHTFVQNFNNGELITET